MSYLVFLSHSGIDTEAAKALKERILFSPATAKHALSVWFDKDDMRAGEPWQRQIEDAIGRSHAFAVYVGSKGVANWVDAEVQLALSRAITEPDYRFVPILAGASPGPESLPGFARQFQSVFDVEARPEQFDKLMRALIGSAEAGRLQLETEPFFGLRAIDESRSHLFFGREKETFALVERIHRTPLVLVTGDSGSGKSSLVHAGLVPRFRGGALALLDGARAEHTIWHIVTTRPRNQPLRQFGDAVDQAAKGLGVSLADRGTLAAWSASGEPDQVRRALRCDLPPERVQVLLVVDQLEELLTITPPELRAPFIDLLLDLADPVDGRHRIVLTMRHDYANLLRQEDETPSRAFQRLQGILDADKRRARFRLGRMSDEGLRQIVTEPLRLAGIEPADRDVLANEVIRDVGERPGDLALVQMALTETWHARHRHADDLLRAYADIGRVEGALAQAAETVRSQVLDDQQRDLLDSVLLRLVRLGDTGGATRRVASRAEFDDASWGLVQKLAGEDGRRLILLTGSSEQPTLEIAHEALVTAWPHFQNLLQTTAPEKRVLDDLIPRAQSWAAAEDQGEREKRLAVGGDLEFFTDLLHERPAWLSEDERRFVELSASMETRKRRRDRLKTRALQTITVALLLAFAVTGWMWRQAGRAQEKVNAQWLAAQSRLGRGTGSDSLTASALLAVQSLKTNRTLEGYLAWAEAMDLLPRQIPLVHERWVETVAFSPDGEHLATASFDGTARLWETDSGEEIARLTHEGWVWDVAFGSEGAHLVTTSESGKARVWKTATGEEIASVTHERRVNAVAFSPDGLHLATASEDGTARVWETISGKQIARLAHGYNVEAIAFGPDGRYLSTANHESMLVWETKSGELIAGVGYGSLTDKTFSPDGRFFAAADRFDNTVQVWETSNRKEIAQLAHDDVLWDMAFSADGRYLATASRDGTVRVWDATDSKEIARLTHEDGVWDVAISLDGKYVATRVRSTSVWVWETATSEVIARLTHENKVSDVAFSFDGKHLATASRDNRARVWEMATGEEIARLAHEDSVSKVAFSPDGEHLAAATSDGAATVWEMASGKVIARLTHEDRVTDLVFSPDGQSLATANTYDTARAWEIATGEETARTTLEGNVKDVTFSSDGRYLAIKSSDRRVQLWEATTGNEIADMTHKDIVWDVVFSPDVAYLATGSRNGEARVWETATGNEIVRLANEDEVVELAFSTDSRHVATGSQDGTARVWETATGEEVARLSHEYPVTKLAVSPDGQHIFTVTDDNYSNKRIARVWEITTGEEVARLPGEPYVRDVTFSPDGQVLATTGGEYNPTRLWDAVTGTEISRLTHQNHVFAVEFSRDSQNLATASADGTARMWETDSGKEIARLEDEFKNLVDMDLSPDGQHVATAGKDGLARVWDTTSGKEVARLAHDDKLLYFIFSTDGRHLATSSSDGTARVWETTTGKEITRLTHEDEVFLVSFMPDGHHLITTTKGATQVWASATGRQVTRLIHENKEGNVALSTDGQFLANEMGGGVVRLWEIATGKTIADLTHEAKVGYFDFSPDGRHLVTICGDNTSRVWKVSNGEEIVRLRHATPRATRSTRSEFVPPGESITGVAFSREGKYIATASRDYTAQVWETATGEVIAHLEHENVVWAVDFSPDGKYLATVCEDDIVRVWQTTTGEEIVRLTHDPKVRHAGGASILTMGGTVGDVAFSPDGEHLATASKNVARVWKISTGEEVARLMHEEYVWRVEFSPGGQYVATASADNTTRVWAWRTEDLIAEACSRVMRNLTQTEWDRYLGDSPYRPTCENLPVHPSATKTPEKATRSD